MKREAGSSQGSWPPPTVVEARAGLFPQNPGSVALPVPCSLLPQDWESLRFCVISPGLFVTAVLGTEPPSTVWSPWRSSHLPSLPAQPKRARPSCPQPPSRSQWLPHFPRRLSHRSFHFLAVPGLLCSTGTRCLNPSGTGCKGSQTLPKDAAESWGLGLTSQWPPPPLHGLTGVSQ